MMQFDFCSLDLSGTFEVRWNDLIQKREMVGVSAVRLSRKRDALLVPFNKI